MIDDARLPSRRRLVLIVAAAAVLILGVLALIAKVARYGTVADSLHQADGRWFPLLLAGELVAFVGYTMAYRGSARARGGPRLPFFLTVRIVAASFAGAVVGMGIGGLAVDYWALHRAGESRGRALARVIALNTLEWALLGAAAAVAAAIELGGLGADVSPALCLGWTSAFTVSFVGAVVVSSPGRAAVLAAWEDRGRVRTLFAIAVAGVVLVRGLLARPLRHAEAVGGALLYWAGLMAVLWGGVRAFGEQLGATALVLAFATGYAVSMLPLPVGGAGGLDAAMTFALNLVGVPLAPALLAVLAYRFFTFWLPLVPAAFAVASVRGIRQRLPLVPHGPPRARLLDVVAPESQS